MVTTAKSTASTATATEHDATNASTVTANNDEQKQHQPTINQTKKETKQTDWSNTTRGKSNKRGHCMFTINIQRQATNNTQQSTMVGIKGNAMGHCGRKSSNSAMVTILDGAEVEP
jgi:hypothetical protein